MTQDRNAIQFDEQAAHAKEVSAKTRTFASGGWLAGKTFPWAIALMLIVDLLSLAVYYSPTVFQAAMIGLLIVLLLVGLRRFEIAVLILVGELFVGGQGRLFSVDVPGFSWSLRMGVFAVTMFVWLVHVIRHREPIRLWRSTLGSWFVLLGIVVLLGAIIGFIRGNDRTMLFFDVNGFLYALVAFPIFQAVKNREMLGRVLRVLAAALVYLAAKNLVLLAVFSHAYGFLPELYRWLRDTRMYEITAMGNNFYRVFSQAQMWSLLGLFVSIGWFSIPRLPAPQEGVPQGARRRTTASRVSLILIFASSLSILASFSRSFWLALILVGVTLVPWALRRAGWSWRRLALTALFTVVLVVLEYGVLSFTANYPSLYGRKGGVIALDLLRDRATELQEPAAVSRYALFVPLMKVSLQHPILGSGFGKTLTFQTTDPRTVEKTGGVRTTYAFEWGFLDLWLKTGILGLFVFLGILLAFIREFRAVLRFGDRGSRGLAWGFLFALAALYLTHSFSPYLNHPIGVGFLAVAGAAALALLEEQKGTQRV